ncbi:MAG: DNA primase [Fimbriimonadales bacterium]|nr:DNA primase [Fimbriimonadales bacterium]MDW8051339.1 DNA primase [Armatimonadota bacterium]
MRNWREAIRERIDLVELVSEYVRLERAGKNFKALCPFHTEKTPSFYVSPALNRFHCFGCGASGDAIAFLMRIEGLSFREALQRLAQRAGIELRSEAIAAEPPNELERLRKLVFAAHFFYRQCLQRTPAAQQYLAQRGLTPETIEAFELGYAPDGWDYLLRFLQKHNFDPRDAEAAGLLKAREDGSGYYDRFRNRIIFPIHDAAGRVVAFGARTLGDEEPKYLNSPETPLFEKRTTLYGWHRARNAIVRQRAAIVVEGYLDLIMLHQYGFTHSVATLGTAFTEEHAARLKRLVERVYLVFDSDAAGVRAALRAGEVLLQAGIPAFVVSLPAGEDPDSLLRSQGAEAFQQALEAAVPVALFGIEQIVREVAGERSPAALEPALKAQIVQRGLEWAASLPSELDRMACLERLAPLTPAYLANRQAALQALQRELRRYARARRGQRQSELSASPAPATAAAPTPLAIPKALFLAESEALRATLYPDSAVVALQYLPEIEWQVPLHAQLAARLQALPQPPCHYPPAELLEQIQEEPLRALLTGLLLQESPPMTPQWAAGCIQRLQDYARRRKRLQLATQLTQHSRDENAPLTTEWLQEYWRIRVESLSLEGGASL